MPERPRRWRAVGLVLAGTLAGTMLVQPVGAHFTQDTKHLGLHAWNQVVKDRVYTRSQANSRYYTKAQIDSGATGCQGVAPDDVMIKVGGICVDAYEASIWDAPVGGSQITGTIPCARHGQDCDNIYARSVEGVTPRAGITWFQAQAALANSGKRLLSNAEWQMAARGTPDPGSNSAAPGCRTAGDSAVPTGSHSACQSVWGAFDMVGNLWEWVGDWVPETTHCPGWSTFSDDRMCLSGASTTATAPGALIRGGSFILGTLAGPLAVDDLRPSSFGTSWGFRGAR